MRHGFKTWAENLALEKRRALGLGATAALPARALGDNLDVTIIGPDEIPGIPPDVLHHLQSIDPESWSATTIMRNGCMVIIHNTTHSPRRQESNLMHELAHLLCGHKPSRLVQYDNFAFPLRSYDSDQEDEAKWLGGCLQLPRTALLWAIREGMANDMIVRHFGASLDQVQYRRRVTGIDRQMSRRRVQF